MLWLFGESAAVKILLRASADDGCMIGDRWGVTDSEISCSYPSRQRVTVVLRVVDGLSEAETAAVMQCSPGTVKSNLGKDRVKARQPHSIGRNRLLLP